MLWNRVRSRRSRISGGGTKPPLGSPHSKSCASHSQSQTSVLRPGTCFTCRALTSRRPKSTSQHGVHRAPVQAGGLHRDIGHTDRGQPPPQPLKTIERCLEGQGLLSAEPPLNRVRRTHARHHRLSVKLRGRGRVGVTFRRHPLVPGHPRPAWGGGEEITRPVAPCRRSGSVPPQGLRIAHTSRTCARPPPGSTPGADALRQSRDPPLLQTLALHSQRRLDPPVAVAPCVPNRLHPLVTFLIPRPRTARHERRRRPTRCSRSGSSGSPPSGTSQSENRSGRSVGLGHGEAGCQVITLLVHAA